jgi:hypothetical protein
MNQNNMLEREKSEKENIPNATITEIETALDRFYASPENLNLPIWRALRVVALKFAARPESEIEAEIETARSVIRDDLERCEKENIGCEHMR